jgi:hypothetical protein
MCRAQHTLALHRRVCSRSVCVASRRLFVNALAGDDSVCAFSHVLYACMRACIHMHVCTGFMIGYDRWRVYLVEQTSQLRLGHRARLEDLAKDREIVAALAKPKRDRVLATPAVTQRTVH